jgi:hypothetical protein
MASSAQWAIPLLLHQTGSMTCANNCLARFKRRCDPSATRRTRLSFKSSGICGTLITMSLPVHKKCVWGERMRMYPGASGSGLLVSGLARVSRLLRQFQKLGMLRPRSSESILFAHRVNLKPLCRCLPLPGNSYTPGSGLKKQGE